jgi:hypothetical protein
LIIQGDPGVLGIANVPNNSVKVTVNYIDSDPVALKVF